mgnify:FL=1
MDAPARFEAWWKAGNYDSRFPGYETAREAFLAAFAQGLAEGREAVRTYGHHLNGCGCRADCKGQQDHVCNCGLDAALREEG